MKTTRTSAGQCLPSAFRVACLFGLVILTGLISLPAFSLGVGGFETQSYIGQRLKVEVPLSNVENPSKLMIKLERLDGQTVEGLSAKLSRVDSKLSILIQSESPVQEPYFNFALTLTDAGNEFSKQFTVLLDLAPSGTLLPSISGAEAAGVAYLTDSSSGNVEAADAYVGAPGSVMGPYDWAKEGAIPEKFGAVLDGQSLWRVARRISPAMNVSNTQMMWALYEANKSAFSNSSIETLQAGSYLRIPSVEMVSSVSDAEAKKLLANLSLTHKSSGSLNALEKSVDDYSATATALTSQELDLSVKTNAELNTAAESSEVNNGFQLTGVDSIVSEEGSLISGDGSQSQEIITSLSNTIISMTEQLGQKDIQIELLEIRVKELQQFIEQEANLDVRKNVSELSSRANEPVSGGLVTTEVSAAQTHDLDLRFVWIGVALLLLAVIMFFLRARLAGIWNALNLAGVKDKVEFQPTVFSDSHKEALALADEFVMSEQLDFSPPSEDSFLDSEGYIENEQTFEESPTQKVPQEELDFEPRFNQLVSEGKLDFARQLLDISHGHGVDQEQYHYYRLKLMAINRDEDAFYDYYYSIENDIQNFDSVVQTKISKLVVQLAKH